MILIHTVSRNLSKNIHQRLKTPHATRSIIRVWR